jgi:hypothetical protein
MRSPMNTGSSTGDNSWIPYTCSIVLLGIIISLSPLQVGSFGTLDFVQYWSAWKLLENGQNPYDAILLHNTQASLSTSTPTLTYSWNPPWTYTLLAPVLTLPFTLAARAWLLAQVAMLFFIAWQAPRALNIRSIGTVGGACAVLSFIPCLYSLRYGQLGTIFALAITSFLLALNTKRYGLAGLSLIPLTLKPHLFLPCAIPGLLWLIQIPRKDMRRFLVGGLGGFAVLVGITLLVAPMALTWWLEAMTQKPSSTSQLVHFKDWMTHTTATALRVVSMATWGTNPTWPLMAIPLVACFGITLVILVRRPTIMWPSLAPRLLCLSLATSSYGWVYDQSALVLCQYLLVAQALTYDTRLVRYGILLGVISPQIIPLVLLTADGTEAFLFFLLPWFFLILTVATTAYRHTALSSSEAREQLRGSSY